MPVEPAASDTAGRIEHLARKDAERLGLPSEISVRRAVEVRLIGQGESYAAWLLEVDGVAQLVVRIARRPIADLPRPMGEEFAALGIIPRDIGPAPIRLDEDEGNPLGAPYMVTGYVPGRVRKLGEWDEDLLAAHARQMARLHERVFDRCGDITTPAQVRSSKLSLTDLFSSSLVWWQGANPDVVSDPDVSRLLPRVEAFVAAAAPAFDLVNRFALIHGDLVIPNILVDDAGTPRYVDWEWAEIGDPARDLALVGGHVPAPPWYLSLDRAQIRRLLAAYLRQVSDMGEETVDALETRCAAWEVYDRFFASLHFRTRRGTPEDMRSGHYTGAVAQLTAGLDRRLAR